MSTKEQESNNSESNISQLAQLLDATGVDAADLALALKSIGKAKEIITPKKESENSIYQEKEYVYDDQNACIFRRGDTKKRWFYFRYYDKKTKTRVVRSLETTDQVQAITSARILYQELKGKIDKGQKLQNITTTELITEYLLREEKKITPEPKKGITPHRFRVKTNQLGYWKEFINVVLNKENTPIDQIAPQSTRDFAYWFQNKPKEKGKGTKRRNPAVINNCISEINKMYRDVGVRERYISRDQCPELDRLVNVVDKQDVARDILERDEYEKLWKFMEYKWCKDKSCDDKEKARRVIFAKTVGLLSNLGTRIKEIRFLRMNEIYKNENNTDPKSDEMLVKIRASNSKTGKGRTIAGNISRRIEVIKQQYALLGITHKPTDYLLLNPKSKTREPYSREHLANTLRKVLKLSGLQEELDSKGKKINLYSFRHMWFTYRLRYGDVPIPLLAKAGGTSIQMLDQTYAHISVEKQSQLLTKGQGYKKWKDVELELTTNVYSTDEE